MNKNKKFKKKVCLVLCLICLLSTLFSVFAVPSSAWTVFDIPFFNYLDIDAVPNTTRNDGRQAYITSKDDLEGTINMSALYTVNDIYYVPYQYSNLTLRDLLPDVTVGETYVLSGEYYNFNFSADNMFMNRINLVNPNWDKQKQWLFGQPLVITEEDLDANVTIMFADFGSASVKPSLGTYVSGSLRLWCNKGEAYEFVAYDIIGDLNSAEIENAYWSGFDDGYNDGSEDGYNEGYNTGKEDAYQEFYKSSIFTRSNYNEFFIVGDTFDINIEQYELYELGYAFDSFVFNPNGYYPLSLMYANGFVSSIYVGFDTVVDNKRLQLGDLAFTLPKSGNSFYSVSIMIYYYDDNNELQFKEYDAIDLGDSYFFDSSTAYDLNRSTIIEKVRFCFWYENETFTAINAYNRVNIVAADTASPSYLFGFESGYNNGYDIGADAGYNNGYEVGYDKGNSDGFNAGTENGIKKGYEQGFGVGVQTGKDLGYENGYYQGIADEQKESTFYTLIYSIVDAPLSAFRSMFNFEILGVNMTGLFLSMITLALVVCVIRFIL